MGQPGTVAPTAGGKVLALLDAFERDHPVLSLSELARRAGLPLSTTHRLAAELLSWGGLERGTDQRYRVGPRLCEVAALAPYRLALRDAAVPYLGDLYEATHGEVQLAVREGLDAVLVERIAGRQAVTAMARTGDRIPLPASGAGLALLAFAVDGVQERVLAGPLPRFTPRTIVHPRQLRRALAEVRRTGLAVSDRQLSMDAVSVAAPIGGPSGEVVAALAVVVPAPAAQPRALGAAVRVTARAIARRLGAPPVGVPRPARAG